MYFAGTILRHLLCIAEIDYVVVICVRILCFTMQYYRCIIQYGDLIFYVFLLVICRLYYSATLGSTPEQS
jgi:hypothetical protein